MISNIVWEKSRTMIKTLKIFLILAVIITVFAVVSCGGNGSRRIVSDIPIKTDILGLKLCEITEEQKIEETVSDAIDEYVITDSQKQSYGKTIRVLPVSMDFLFGGFSWMYVDIDLNKEGRVAAIRLTSSYENVESAQRQYDQVSALFKQKYGNGNLHPSNQLTFWTDNVNSVGVEYEQSSAINGNDRSFCVLYYVNIALADSIEEANASDI